jgi:hypothetical protein
VTGLFCYNLPVCRLAFYAISTGDRDKKTGHRKPARFPDALFSIMVPKPGFEPGRI